MDGSHSAADAPVDAVLAGGRNWPAESATTAGDQVRVYLSLASVEGMPDDEIPVDQPSASRGRALRRRLALGSGYLAVIDLVILIVGIAFATRIGLGIIALAVVVLALFASGDLYGPRFTLSVLDDLPSIAVRVLIACMFIESASIFRQHVLAMEVEVKLTLWFFGLTVLVRTVCYAVVRNRRRGGHLQQRTLIVGAGKVGTRLARLLDEHKEFGARPVGFLDDRPLTPAHELPVPLLGTEAALNHLIKAGQVDVVIIAFGSLREPGLVEVIRTCHRHRCEIYFVPRLFEMQSRGENDHVAVAGIPLIRLRRAIYRTLAWRCKRVFDMVAGTIFLILGSPVFLACAIAVRLQGPGVFFRQVRVGVDGRPITILKFRTLNPANETEALTTWNISQDARLTSIGRFLRKTSLDELPQFWSIVRGDMSLVGPRPERQHFVDEFTHTYHGYSARHRVPVGLTGLAQVNGLRGDTSIEERARLDNDYIENWSLWLDMKIIIRTCALVFRGTGG